MANQGSNRVGVIDASRTVGGFVGIIPGYPPNVEPYAYTGVYVDSHFPMKIPKEIYLVHSKQVLSIPTLAPCFSLSASTKSGLDISATSAGRCCGLSRHMLDRRTR
ncbi:hypothetical protein RRG08_054657 [Elysia crispata]|uniref:Uncharacterized protein n=1 Tax=Elysia crispata TaxID=231223 RepID=A0AAE1B2E5_9GAST|nr:hypothetical protein RRG08_054657 [Elysia crispata]